MTRPDDAYAPILVLGSGQRCGSTLVQRLLTSHSDVLIWGEHGGHIRDLLAMTDVLRRWDQGVAVDARESFEKGGHQSWMANVLPGPDAVLEASRAFLLAFFQAPAAARGRERWGFKEVRFGLSEARGLRELFPGLCAIHITRDPRDVLVSLDEWERKRGWWRREFTARAVREWLEVNSSFLPAREGGESWVLSVRYEDVVADPDTFIAAVARLMGAQPHDFDRAVFERRIHDYGDRPRVLRAWPELPRELRAMLCDDRIREVAAAYGYELASTDRRSRRQVVAAKIGRWTALADGRSRRSLS